MRKIPAFLQIWVLLLVLPATGCLLRSHRVERAAALDATLRTATVTELISQVNAQASAIKTLTATVDIATSVGGSKSGRVTEYQEIRGYILVRQPNLLRMTGLMPVVRTRAFDMVSSGPDFKLYIPQKSRLYIGKNDAQTSGGTGLAGLRPHIIYNALLLNDINLLEDIAVLESGQEIVTDSKSQKKVPLPDYRLDVIHRGPGGWYLERKIYFDRTALKPRRQRVYDMKGDVVSDILYGKWQEYGELSFPSVIEILRPVEEYRITLGMVKLDLNQPLTDKQFELIPPEGTAVMPVEDGKKSATQADPAGKLQ